MREAWGRLTNLGVRADMTPTDARYVVLANISMVNLIITTVVYLVAIAVLQIGIVPIVALLPFLGAYVLVLWLNHRGRYDAALDVGAWSMVAANTANFLLFGCNIHVYLLGLMYGAPLVFPPRRQATLKRVVLASLVIVIACELVKTTFAHPFDLVYVTAFSNASIIGAALSCVGLSFYARQVTLDAEERVQHANTRLIETETNAAMSRLVAGILHEVNTPLGAIRSSSSSMRTTLERCGEHIAAGGDDKKTRRLVRGAEIGASASTTIDDAVHRIASLVERLQRFTRLDGAERATIDLRESLDDALAILRCQAVRRYDEDLPAIHCYPARINGALLNILQNAARAVETPEQIRVRATTEDDQVLIEIADEGTGIPPEQLATIFQIGFAAKDGRVGMRLGLPMAKRHIEEAGGQIHIASRPDHGTQVRVLLPVAP